MTASTYYRYTHYLLEYVVTPKLVIGGAGHYPGRSAASVLLQPEYVSYSRALRRWDMACGKLKRLLIKKNKYDQS